MTPALLILLAQATKPLEMPVGTNAEFQSLVADIVASSKAGKWDEAESKARLLPSRTVTLEYDDSAVPAAQRPLFRQSIDDAFAVWKQRMTDATFEVKPGGAIKVAYAPELAKNPETGMVRGAAPFWSLTSPRLEYVIGLTRSNPPQPINQNHVTQETVFAIGSWFGLAQIPVTDSPMARTDTLSALYPRIDRGTASRARDVLDFCDRIRAGVKAHQAIGLAFPKAVFGLTQFKGEPIDEGKPYRFGVPISNTGDGELRLALVPDCSCFTYDGTDRIAPGQTKVIEVVSDTRGFVGKQDKALYFYTNDPEEPVRMVRVSEFVRPRFRLVDPLNGRPVAVDPNGTRATFFVYAPSGTPFSILQQGVSGVAGTVSVSPLSEPIADPEMDDAVKARVGYRVDVLMSSTSITGRVNVSVTLKTDDKSIPYVTYPITLQDGIVAQPEEIFFGTGPRKAKTRSTTLISADGPFKVLGIESSDPAVTATFHSVAPDRVRIDTVLKDTVDTGEFVGELRVRTDSKRQPVVRVRLRATVL